MKESMNIKDTFLSLTSRTYPHGTEADLFYLLPQDLEIDEFGNLYKIVGDKYSTMFACHLDTATSALTDVDHVIDGDIIKTDGTSILGADDKAGVTILMYMIENNIPGLYYFFLGEEVGCVGSKKLAELHKTKKIDCITKVISFDRRGTTSIITHQCSSRCCSDDFGTALANALNIAGAEIYDNDTVLNYKNDPTGLYTDSAQFTRIYPECTNISVGYQGEHTFNETQNIKHLDKLAKAALLVDWESLPISRDPSVVDYSGYCYGGGGWSSWDDEYSYGNYGSYSSKPKQNFECTENVWVHDDFYGNYITCITINKWTKKVTKVDISNDRIGFELGVISQFLMALNVKYESITWDGFKLSIVGRNQTECDRNELSEYIPELMFWKDIDDKENEKYATFKSIDKSISYGAEGDYPSYYD